MKNIFKNLILFFVFGAIYCGIELVWRGHTDISMAVVGGLGGMIIGTFNERSKDMPLLLQCFLGMCLITLFEGCAGVILNIWLKLDIWNYSDMPFQFFWGQCCFPYCALWFILAGVAVYLDDWLRDILFK